MHSLQAHGTTSRRDRHERVHLADAATTRTKQREHVRTESPSHVKDDGAGGNDPLPRFGFGR
jgi:hypothetical protein